MIANLLHRSRIEEGKEQHFPVDVSLGMLAQDAVEQLRQLAAANGQHLELIGDSTPIQVWADPDGVNRILTNLIENALKYTPRQGSIRVVLEVQDAKMASVSIADTGEGIAPDDIPRLFDPFYRAARHQKGSKKEGLGLGLSIVKQLVELHGGSIWVESREGAGSTFRFTLPLSRPLDRRPPTHDRAPRRVLLVDDDADIRQLLADRLTADGYDVLTAPDGREALACLGTERFDGMILDIGLPHIDGLRVLQALRDRQRDVPVIMITAAAAQERALQALEAGAQAYLLKPLDAQEFKRTVDRWFRGASQDA
jgi:CheY-like chemotaxis protein